MENELLKIKYILPVVRFVVRFGILGGLEIQCSALEYEPRVWMVSGSKF